MEKATFEVLIQLGSFGLVATIVGAALRWAPKAVTQIIDEHRKTVEQFAAEARLERASHTAEVDKLASRLEANTSAVQEMARAIVRCSIVNHEQ